MKVNTRSETTHREIDDPSARLSETANRASRHPAAGYDGRGGKAKTAMADEPESPAKMSTAATAAHRKIELQSPEDLAFLVANVRRAAAESIAAAFPPVEGAAAADDKDDLHASVEALVDEVSVLACRQPSPWTASLTTGRGEQYIQRTFALAAPNLSINGLPVGDVAAYLGPAAGAGKRKRGAAAATAEAYEPFDARARQRVEDLSREEEDLLRDLAALKRKVPAAVARQHAEAAAAALRADEERLAAAIAAAEAQGAGGDGRGLVVEALERQAGVEGAFARAVDTLARLKAGMPATVAKMERARVAGEYVVAGR